MSSKRRWDVSAEELDEITRQPPPGPRHVLRALRRRPHLLRTAVGSAVRGAIEGVRSDAEINWFARQLRVERVVPGLATGATWFGDDQFLAVLRPHLHPESRVLELGAGAGRVTRHVAPFVREVVATDVSKAMVDEARLNLRKHANVAYMQTRGVTLPQFGDGEFDGVYSHDVFEFFDANPALSLLDEGHRVLRPGGFCAVSFYTLNNPAMAGENLRIARRIGRSGHVGAAQIRPYATAQVEALLRLAGFAVVERHDGGPIVEGGPTQDEAIAAHEAVTDVRELNDGGRCVLVGIAR